MKQKHEQSSNLKQGSVDRDATGSKQGLSGSQSGRGSMSAGSSDKLSEGNSRERKSTRNSSHSDSH